MEPFKYKLAGVYRDRLAAQRALEHIVNAGFAPEQVRCAWPDDDALDRKLEPATRATRNQLIRNALVGTVAGAVLGMIAALLIAARGEGLFAQHPLWGPMIVIGYAVAVGLVVGAVSALPIGRGALAARVTDELNRGAYAIIVQARDSREARKVRRLLEELPVRQKILH